MFRTITFKLLAFSNRNFAPPANAWTAWSRPSLECDWPGLLFEKRQFSIETPLSKVINAQRLLSLKTQLVNEALTAFRIVTIAEELALKFRNSMFATWMLWVLFPISLPMIMPQMVENSNPQLMTDSELLSAVVKEIRGNLSVRSRLRNLNLLSQIVVFVLNGKSEGNLVVEVFVV